MHSARREIGTQTSVTMPLAPGRSAMVAQNASWRACHRRLRSSARAVHWNSAPPQSRAIARTVSACSATWASEPWNSKNSVGAAW